jgi:hypothetical protein
VSSYGMAARCGTVGMVKGAGVPFGGGVVVMGMAGITTLQCRVMVKPELLPSLEVESSLLANSSRMACSDDDLL